MASAYNRTRLPIQLRNLTKFRSSAHFYDTEEKRKKNEQLLYDMDVILSKCKM